MLYPAELRARVFGEEVEEALSITSPGNLQSITHWCRGSEAVLFGGPLVVDLPQVWPVRAKVDDFPLQGV
jgi:hypothetical protein